MTTPRFDWNALKSTDGKPLRVTSDCMESGVLFVLGVGGDADEDTKRYLVSQMSQCQTIQSFQKGTSGMNHHAAIFLMVLWLFSGHVYAASFTGKLIKVLDGDTVEVLHDGKAERIRLAQIDAPEKNQPFGQAAKKYVLDIAAHKIVTVQVDTVDRYGRTVGEVFLPDGSNLNKLIVGAGYAWQYKRYSKDPVYGDLEERAKIAKLGLWQDMNPVPPWKWRRGQRQASSTQSTGRDFTCGSEQYHKEKTACVEDKSYLLKNPS